MNVHPYLNFDGQAEEAFTLYQSVFGGQVTATMSMSSDTPEADWLPAEERTRISHIALSITDDTTLTASDTVPSAGHVFRPGNQTHVLLSPDSQEEADRLFDGLSSGGGVLMEMQEIFWGDD